MSILRPRRATRPVQPATFACDQAPRAPHTASDTGVGGGWKPGRRTFAGCSSQVASARAMTCHGWHVAGVALTPKNQCVREESGEGLWFYVRHLRRRALASARCRMLGAVIVARATPCLLWHVAGIARAPPSFLCADATPAFGSNSRTSP